VKEKQLEPRCSCLCCRTLAVGRQKLVSVTRFHEEGVRYHDCHCLPFLSDFVLLVEILGSPPATVSLT
jgi:hypothetical protein